MGFPRPSLLYPKKKCFGGNNRETCCITCKSTRSAEMATTTLVTTAAAQPPRRKTVDLAPESERFLRCCADVANALIEDHESTKDGKTARDINLNSLRSKLAKKYRLTNIPPLTAIIAAIPEHYKKYILPKLIAKPIRKATPRRHTSHRALRVS